MAFYKQISNSSMHIFVAITSFSVPVKGRPKQLTHTRVLAAFITRAPQPRPRHILLVPFISNGWAVVDLVSPDLLVRVLIAIDRGRESPGRRGRGAGVLGSTPGFL